MVTRDLTLYLYTYAELSNSAKQHAHEKFSEFGEPLELDWYKEILEIIGISSPTIYYSGFCCQGDGACFIGEYSYKKGFLKEIKSHCSDDELIAICTQLYELQKKNFYRLTASLYHRGHYHHEFCMHDSSYDANDDLLEITRDLATWIYRGLEKEYDYLTSEQYFIEYCNDTSALFEENGVIYYE